MHAQNSMLNGSVNYSEGYRFHHSISSRKASESLGDKYLKHKLLTQKKKIYGYFLLSAHKWENYNEQHSTQQMISFTRSTKSHLMDYIQAMRWRSCRVVECFITKVKIKLRNTRRVKPCTQELLHIGKQLEVMLQHINDFIGNKVFKVG